MLVYLKSGWGECKKRLCEISFKQFFIFLYFLYFMGWGSREGCINNNNNNYFQISVLGVENSEFPVIFSSCSGM